MATDIIAVVIAGLGLVFGMAAWHSRNVGAEIGALKKKLGNKQDRDMCAKTHETMEKALERGGARFDAILHEQKKQSETLVAMNTALKILIPSYKGVEIDTD